MKNIFKNKNIALDDGGLQDVIFLVGIFLFISILIIGLFPGQNMGIVINREFFIYAVMTIPAIAAIYFIIISFRRNLNFDSAIIGSSIRKKMVLAFIFIAVLSSLPIVLASSYLLNQTLSNLIFDKTYKALNESISMSNEPIVHMHDNIIKELDALDYMIGKGILTPTLKRDRDYIRSIYLMKGISVLFYKVHSQKFYNRIDDFDYVYTDYHSGFKDFYKLIDLKERIRVDTISIKNKDYLAGSLKNNEFLIVLYSDVPALIKKRVELYSSSLEDYRRLEYIKTYFKGGIGIFMLGLSIFIIVISVLVSIYLSKNITRPVLELSKAAKEVAQGNFNIRIHRESEDELGLLFNSFNQMVSELENNKKTMYQKQRLEAWREMARRVVHEIKNPLTPIRLSAERMRKRFLDNSGDMKEVILSGTETIVEEVEVLMNILSEFTKFARLPEMKPVKADINQLIENCVNFFSGHENINFKTEIDGKIPEIYIDKILMRQALINLIQNAVDAVGAEGNITLKSELINRFGIVRIKIIDDGVGIKDYELEKIFEPGFSTKTSGTGLGLAIVEKIVIEHSGKIYCNSKYNMGTEFVIELPISSGEVEFYG